MLSNATFETATARQARALARFVEREIGVDLDVTGEAVTVFEVTDEEIGRILDARSGIALATV